MCPAKRFNGRHALANPLNRLHSPGVSRANVDADLLCVSSFVIEQRILNPLASSLAGHSGGQKPPDFLLPNQTR